MGTKNKNEMVGNDYFRGGFWDSEKGCFRGHDSRNAIIEKASPQKSAGFLCTFRASIISTKMRMVVIWEAFAQCRLCEATHNRTVRDAAETCS